MSVIAAFKEFALISKVLDLAVVIIADKAFSRLFSLLIGDSTVPMP